MAGRLPLLAALCIFACASCATSGGAKIAGGPLAPAVKFSPPLPRVHFATASKNVIGRNRRALLANARWMAENPESVIVLEGHCDERGSWEYNLELGDKRAREVKAKMINEGIEPERVVMVISQGEASPIDARHTPGAWRKNRRVEFLVR